MTKLLILLILFCSCQKETDCGEVIKKLAISNIHGTYLDIQYPNCVIRLKVDLPTYTSYNVGDQYCP
jgi:hypothetical protein